MARSSAVLLPAALVALCLCGILRPAFVPTAPRVSKEAAAGVAAAMLAATAAAPLPADAITAKFSVFGFGEGSSDPYTQNDGDAISPFSPFSNPKDSIYKKGADSSIIARKKSQLDDSFKRLEKIPGLLAVKDRENVKSTLTLQTNMMRANMEYLSGETDSPNFKKARQFFNNIADCGVFTLNEQFSDAKSSYDQAMASLGIHPTFAESYTTMTELKEEGKGLPTKGGC